MWNKRRPESPGSEEPLRGAWGAWFGAPWAPGKAASLGGGGAHPWVVPFPEGGGLTG